jgi:hypothetical protein
MNMWQKYVKYVLTPNFLGGKYGKCLYFIYFVDKVKGCVLFLGHLFFIFVENYYLCLQFDSML